MKAQARVPSKALVHPTRMSSVPMPYRPLMDQRMQILQRNITSERSSYLTAYRQKVIILCNEEVTVPAPNIGTYVESQDTSP